MLKPQPVSRFSDPNKQGLLVIVSTSIASLECNICYDKFDQNTGCPTHPVCKACLCKLENATCPVCRQDIPITASNKDVLEQIKLKENINKYISVISDNFIAYYLQYINDGSDMYKVKMFLTTNFFILANLLFNDPKISESDIINKLYNNQEKLFNFYQLVTAYWQQNKSNY